MTTSNTEFTDGEKVVALEQRLNYEFRDKKLLEQSLTHKSHYNETKNKTLGHNEKLEFLGDAVLDLSLSHKLYNDFPQFDEGDLSKYRAALVNETSLAELSLGLHLDEILKLGKGELKSGGKKKPRLLASVFEALVGAFYLDAGYEKVNKFVLDVFGPLFESLDPENSTLNDYKTMLQEKTQDIFKTTPEYEVTDEDGPDHDKVFSVEVKVDGKVFAEGKGKSKKQAEQAAAKEALEKLP